MTKMKERVLLICPTCNKSFTKLKSQIKSKIVYCSKPCHYNRYPVGTILTNSRGYIVEKVANCKWTKQHRRIAGETLGRPILRNEDVHHDNHEQASNTEDNLVVLSHSEHARLHGLTNHNHPFYTIPDERYFKALDEIAAGAKIWATARKYVIDADYLSCIYRGKRRIDVLERWKAARSN
jgi:hypothetical protein